MKFILFVIVIIFSSTTFADEAEKLTNDNAGYIYESRTKLPISLEKLAAQEVADYRNARDEFSKHEMLEKIKPELVEKLKAAKDISDYQLKVGVIIGQYDFEKNRFPSGFVDTTFIPFIHDYAVTFSNIKNIEYIPIPLDIAKDLSSSLQKSRDITAIIDCKILGTKIETLGYLQKKVLITKVSKVYFYTDDGKLIAGMNDIK